MSDSVASLGHYTVERYLALVDEGLLDPDDRTELLDGIIVSTTPQSPPDDAITSEVQYALLRKLGFNVVIRVRSGFQVGEDSLPQPDVSVIPGHRDDYWRQFPTSANLLVEVALSTVAQDRLTKAAIYARAAVPCYWIVNLRDHCVEVYSNPDPRKSEYRSVVRATGSQPLTIDAYPGVIFQAADFLPPARLHIESRLH